jgi:PAS domain S-box-containing protein
MIILIAFLLLYFLIDLSLFHEWDFNKKLANFNYHELWTYLIIILFLLIIFLFSSLIIKKQIILDKIIKKSERRYLTLIEGSKDLFSSIQDGIVVLDKNLNIIQVNPTVEKWYSYKEPIIGKKCFELYSYNEEPCGNCPNLNLIRKEPIYSRIRPKYDQDGKENGWLEIYSFPLFNENTTEILGIINYCKDITERINAEKIIKNEIIRLKELDNLKNEFIRRFSHELKTPLNSIQSSTQNLLLNYKDSINSKTFQFIDIIHKGGLRLKRLVENILEASIMEERGLVLNKERTNISKMVEKCIFEIKPLAVERNLVLKSKLSNNVYLNVDGYRFEEVILNLLSNAIKNTPPNGQILIDIMNINNHIELKVSDSGIGLTKKEKELLFTPFGKIERIGINMNIDTEGSGLGLYLSNQIIQLHGGQIIAESEGRNKGSTFIVRFFKR